MVTRILFDPRRDLTDGTTTSNPVIVAATPTGISETGAVVVIPTTLTFTITTGADLLQLVPSLASWAWRLVIRDAVTNVILQQRTVKVPDVASVPYQSLIDVDPLTLAVTAGAARNWDATFTQILQMLQAITNAALDDVNAWAPNTAYTAGTVVLNPSEQFVTANTSFTSGATYNPANWTIQTLNLAGVQALVSQAIAGVTLASLGGITPAGVDTKIATQAASDSVTYATLAQLGAITTVDNGNGTITISATGSASATDNGNGTIAIAA